MDDKRASTIRTSGIPKPSSRLPLPRSGIPTPASSSSSTPTTRLQKKPSTSALPQSSTVGSARGRQVRPVASQEKINPSATLPRSYRPGAASTKPLSATANDSTSKSSSLRLQNPPTSTESPLKKPALAKRRPLSQIGHSYGRQSGVNLTENIRSPNTVDETPELPPLIHSSAESPTDAFSTDAQTPRLSLSERTIETLSKLPSSPIRKQRATSAFFDTPASSKGSISSVPVSRPGSSCQSDGSTSHESRHLSPPGSSSGHTGFADTGSTNVRATTGAHRLPSASGHATPSKRFSTYTPSSVSTTTKLSHRLSMNNISSRSPLSPSAGTFAAAGADKHSMGSTPRSGVKSATVRPTKARGSIKGLFDKPANSSPADAQTTSNVPHSVARKPSIALRKASTASLGGRDLASHSTTPIATTEHSGEEAASSSKKSSAALRDQIAKAKAAKRAAGRQDASAMASADANVSFPGNDDAFAFELSDDPFGQKKFEDSNKKVMQSRIATARTTGRLNIVAMGLKEIPSEVLKMYDLESMGCADGSWAESVDVTRLIAADNELETIDDSLFPDIDPTTLDADSVDDKVQIFLGLESADLHNNVLMSLPVGLRRLPALNALNLTSNKLTNDCLEVITQCTNLRDLKLGNNLLSGPIENALCLENLEILDLHGNSISALPSNIDSLKRLRVLNLDENALESLPFQSLSTLPISELRVRKNKLQGTLIEDGVEGMPQLQILDCSNNMLSYLHSPESTQMLQFPVMHQLTVSMNQLKALPDVTSWTSLTTINADGNSIAALPEGFTSRENLRHAEFTNNDIRIIPPEIARMDNLVMLRITGNPLRDKKFASLTTEALKDALLARLEPLPCEVGGVENFANGIYTDGPDRPDVKTTTSTTHAAGDSPEGHSDSDQFATPPTSAPHSPSHSPSQSVTEQLWPVKPGGILDRSSTQSSTLDPVVCSKVVAVQVVREVRLDHNTFTQFPDSLSFFSGTVTSLSLAHNQLSGETWLTERLDLSALRELNLQSNACTSLTPLATYLCAPNLEKLDVSLNRIVQIPTLRDSFPSLAVLLIANNRLEELDPEKIRGLKIVDASNNEIAHLNPRIGLLGLDRLEVMGNRFRVPRWNILERGTEATLRWLRGRVPVAEMGEWRAEGGVDEDHSITEVD